MTTTEMVSVMQAHADGKEIEVIMRKGEGMWVVTKNPCWDWSSFEYRIKPEPPKPKYVPYESAEEFIAAQKEHGPYLYNMIKGEYYIPIQVNEEGVTMMYEEKSIHHTFANLLRLPNNYIWQDGTPVGELKEE